MLTVYKSEQVDILSEKLKLPKTTIKLILDTYINMLREQVLSGKTVKILNICYLRVASDNNPQIETLAYVSTEIARQLLLEKTTVFGVLSSFEECVVSDLKKFYNYNISGLVKISIKEFHNSEYKVRITKSVSFNNLDIRVITLGSFKRKVETAK